MTKLYRFVSTFVLIISVLSLNYAQSGPNCVDLNASVNFDGDVSFTIEEMVPNIGGASATVTITRSYGGIVYGPATLSAGMPIIFEACPYLRETLKVTVEIDGQGACWSYLTFKQGNGPIIEGRTKDVYCFDPLVAGGHINDEPPAAGYPCVGMIAATHAADWTINYECAAPGEPVNDTAKVILREYEAFDKNGNRASGFDTIVVFRLPPISLLTSINAYCAEKDTTYCGEGFAGPFMLIPERCDPALFGQDQDGDGVPCDTLYFLVYDTVTQMWVENPIFQDNKCGLGVHVDKWVFEGSSCEQQVKYVLDIKQACIGTPQTACTVMPVPTDNAFEEVAEGYYRCEFWLTDLDTVPPEVDCKDDNLLLTTIYTSSHECAAHTYVPPVYVEDDWTGIKQVKASIEGYGTFIFSYNQEKDCYESHQTVKLHHRELPYKVIYEAYDSCHNIGYDSCYIRVKDGTRPVAIADKGVTVSLSDKKVWVEAETFDEGSWDNCGVNLLLARRADWYEACIDLCDSVDYCWVGEHHDTLWQAYLQPDKHKDEVEAHYAKTLDWLCNDDVPCGDVIYNAWQYDLMKHATLKCVEHPYDVGEEYFNGLLRDAIMDPEFANKWKNASTLFIGNSNNFTDVTADDAYYLGMDGSVTSAIAQFPVWGATTDFDNERILFTSSVGSSTGVGDQLYALPFGGTQPVNLGELVFGGFPFRIDGLAIVDGVLYGVRDGNTSEDGLYEIDLSSLELSLVATYVPSVNISGIDADPLTGIIYGADDNVRKIVQIDPVTGARINVADFPAGENDIDGVAVGSGKIFLVTDQPGEIYVYNISSGQYEQAIPSPFTASEIFSGGAAFMPMLEDLVDEWSQIGGGWAEEVPFSCDDACGPVTVELLVMDYWCNWSKAWTTVWVEDKTPVSVEKDVYSDEEISCKTYKDARYSYPGEIHPVSIEYIVEQSKTGDSTALAQLDAIFGGYCKAWVDPYGNYVDIEGNEIDCDIYFYDSSCYCSTDVEEVRVYDEHLGYLWKDSLVTDCYYEEDTLHFQKGIITVNCAENVFCEQEVWCDIDHCGQGYIFRKWKIWQGCPDSYYKDETVPDSLKHPVDTIYRSQRIWVGNQCELSKYMFDVPGDMTVYTCGIDYDPEGSGNVVGEAGPENTGYATYKFDDDCRIVGIAHTDKVFKIVGGEEACYKIYRTWYFADWCGYGGKPVKENWYKDYDLVVDSCVQKIIVQDTMPPVCTITGPVGDGETITIGACEYDLNVTVDAADACGISKYYWELKDVTDPDAVTVFDDGHGELNADTADVFDISSENLYPGSYTLIVTVQDECNNESYCKYDFELEAGKKPSPICVTNISARLTPWDSDQDGEIDTAHAVVWAGEFDSSSEPACTDDSLGFRIEFLDLVGDSTYVDDADSLELGCADIGTHLVRLWVISYPSETVDYCDVILTVQSDFTGCFTNGTGEKTETVQETAMNDALQSPDKHMMEGEQTELNIPGDAPASSGISTEGYELEQNRPNPFRNETMVGFVLPQSMQATITVHDVTGRVLREVKGSFAKGYNTVQFRKSDLGVSGILYYRLQAGSYTATRKMVLVN